VILLTQQQKKKPPDILQDNTDGTNQKKGSYIIAKVQTNGKH